MKRFFRFLLIAAFAIIAVACAKDIVDLTGDITGVVKDDADGHLIENCQVALGTTGRSVITNADGQFAFEGVEPGDYQLSFKRTGYNDVTKNVTVVNGQTARADVMMKQKSAFSLSLNELDFGDLSTSNSIIISNNSSEIIAFEVSGVPAWAKVNQTKGSLASGTSETIVFTVNRDAVDYGNHSAIVTFKHNKGSETLKLLMKKVKLSAPEVSIASAATEVTENSFHIGGTIKATGGAEVSAYGHCWSRESNPTVNDNHTSLGATVETLDFTSIVGNLSVGTTYHIRAYATNAHGTSYSQEITVTTQDVASNKWDGTVAQDFARGKGTIASPYIIETGAQLLHLKDVDTSNKYFKLANDIDLDNRNWMPIPEFKGYFDGNGCTIRNLSIKRSGNNIGLFGSASNVKNLTVNGVHIEAEGSNVGCIVGCFNFAEFNFENIHVVFTEDSYISGTDNVGGIAGSLGEGSYTHLGIIKDCSVSSTTPQIQIESYGNAGGIVGYAKMKRIENCNVQIQISTEGPYLGGIAGEYRGIIERCSFKGELFGKQYIGGIVGISDGNIIASKVIADIHHSSADPHKTAAGIAANRYGTIDVPVCNSCYFVGTGVNRLTGFHGISFSYICTKNADGADISIVYDERGKANEKITDIATFMSEMYSTYAEYWNFDKTFTWTGNIGGNKQTVKCPSLAWE